MKKIVSIIMAVCLSITALPVIAISANITPEISLDEFISQLSVLQKQYDESYIGELAFEDGSEFYHVDGESFLIQDENGETITSSVSNGNLDVPEEIIEQNCAESVSSEAQTFVASNHLDTVDFAESLGYEVEISEDKAVLTQPYQTHRLIVKSKYNIDPLDSIAIVEGYNNLHIVQFDNIESTIAALEYYENQNAVEYAEPDVVMSTMEYEDASDSAVGGASADLPYGNHLSWGSENIGVDDYIDYLGDISALPEIVVGIIDTGVDLDHEFLQNRLIPTGFNISDSGTSNSEEDDHYHGTHVAGIVADNTTENVKIKSYKALNNTGNGNLLNICLAIDKAVEDGVNVINMSLGGPGPSKEMEASVKNAVKNGVIVCVAAGNEAVDASKRVPAGIEECITVAAMDEALDRPFWTNFGPMVDIIAPGDNIYSTYIDNTYESLGGTSMASPFVAAASALILSKDSGLNSDELLGLLEENAKDSGVGFKLRPKVCDICLYIGEITTYGRERTIQPTVSLESGRYSDGVYVELSCPEEAEIYYTVDGSRATQNYGTLYTEPIFIDKVTRLHAVAVAEGKLKSLQTVADYYITSTDPEGNFEIDTNGLITAYNGTNNYLTIPDTINGITVTGIGTLVFRDSAVRDTLVMVKCPNTLNYVGEKAFYHIPTLVSFDCDNLKTVGEYAFQQCKKLYNIDLTQLEEVDRYAFHGCVSIPGLKNDKLTVINKYSFNSLQNAVGLDLPNVTRIETGGIGHFASAEYVNLPKLKFLGAQTFVGWHKLLSLDLPNVTEFDSANNAGQQFMTCFNLVELNIPKFQGAIPRECFSGCHSLKVINLPGATSVGDRAFNTTNCEAIILENCTAIGANVFDSSSVKNIYMPKLESIPTKTFIDADWVERLFIPSCTSIQDLPECDGTVIYLSDKLTTAIDEHRETSLTPPFTYTVIAPEGSNAYEWAKKNNYKFEDSYSMVDALGGTIRLFDKGLRFGFSWKELSEINKYSSSIEYGFEYGKDRELSLNFAAENKVYHADTNNTTFNLVLTNVPLEAFETLVYARAYVNIDGMIFKSPILERSFYSTGNSILNSDSVDENTKNEIRKVLGEYDEKHV